MYSEDVLVAWNSGAVKSDKEVIGLADNERAVPKNVVLTNYILKKKKGELKEGYGKQIFSKHHPSP